MVVFVDGDVPCNVEGRRRVKSWLAALAKHHNRSLGDLSIVSCSDEELLTYEQKFLEGTSWVDTEHVKAATLSNQVVKLCQQGNKILPLLKSWQKYEPLS